MYENLRKVPWFDLHIASLWFFKFVEGTGNKKLYLSESFVKARNVSLIIYFAELFLCFFRIGLYSIRRFLISIIVNIVFLFLTLLGTYGGLTINPFFVIIHWGGVLVVYVIFIIMMIATTEDSHGDSKGEIFAFYIPLIIEVIPLFLLVYFNYVICKFQINYEKQEKIRLEAERNLNIANINPSNQTNNEMQAIGDINHNFQVGSEEQMENQKIPEFVIPFGEINQVKPESEGLCCVCLKAEYNSVFIPCGHVCCCINCGKKVFDMNRKCPLCKKSVEKCQKIYKA